MAVSPVCVCFLLFAALYLAVAFFLLLFIWLVAASRVHGQVIETPEKPEP